MLKIKSVAERNAEGKAASRPMAHKMHAGPTHMEKTTAGHRGMHHPVAGKADKVMVKAHTRSRRSAYYE